MGKLLQANAHELRESVWGEYEAVFDPLTSLQKAVLMAMAQASHNRKAFTPYRNTTLVRVAELAVQYGQPDASPTKQTIQAALEALRDKGLVWRSGSGVYSFEDGSMMDWLRTL